jgi:hypothetical protein
VPRIDVEIARRAVEAAVSDADERFGFGRHEMLKRRGTKMAHSVMISSGSADFNPQTTRCVFLRVGLLADRSQPPLRKVT